MHLLSKTSIIITDFSAVSKIRFPNRGGFYRLPQVKPVNEWPAVIFFFLWQICFYFYNSTANKILRRKIFRRCFHRTGVFLLETWEWEYSFLLDNGWFDLLIWSNLHSLQFDTAVEHGLDILSVGILLFQLLQLVKWCAKKVVGDPGFRISHSTTFIFSSYFWDYCRGDFLEENFRFLVGQSYSKLSKIWVIAK